ncbi:MAG: hypothetical protein H8E27_03020 [Verrucomicrobia subdivision 3 bacterium]|nr:hypothetical protein [Limisphaerales bacterium]
MQRFLLAWIVLLAGWQSVESAPAVTGYLPHYRAGLIDTLPVEKLTDIIFFSIAPKADGSLDTKNARPEALQKLTTRAHAKKVRVHICVGGWGLSAGFAPMTANATARATFVRQLTAFVRKHNLQGADMDWEHPKTAAEIANYQTLLIELKRAFAPHRLWLTVAAAGWGNHLKRETFPFIDRIHVMAYDQGTPHAPFAGAVKDLRYWESQGAPKAKLLLGLPFYGRNAQNTARTYGELVAQFSPQPNTDVAGGFHFNGATTIRRKTQHAIRGGYGGVMIWELGQDAAGKASLLDTVRAALPR